MIIPIDIKPEKSLYVIGAKIMEVFNNESMGVIDIKILYEKFIKIYQENISFDYYLYALDWLFLIDLININKKSEVIKCF